MLELKEGQNRRILSNSNDQFYLIFAHFSQFPFKVKELVTPPLNGLILPGITRDSILTLARQWGDCIVTERSITMQEVCKLVQQERVSLREIPIDMNNW